MRKSPFDQLLDDLFDEATAKTAARDETGGDRHSIDEVDTAILRILKRMSAIIVTQGQAIRALQAGSTPDRPPPLAKALPRNSVSSEDFMAKAMAAQAAGKIGGLAVATAEQCINAGQQPPADIVRAVVEAEAGA